jgi:dGTPase
VTTNTATSDTPPWNLRQYEPSRGSERRSSYDVDRDRIIHCETFRELQHKTQVQSIVYATRPATFRTRLNHVIEVAQIARGVARTLQATETLCEAIALAQQIALRLPQEVTA